MCLQNIYFLLNLLHHLFYHILSSPDSNSIFMHSLDGRRRNIKTFDIDLATSKHSRNLVQQTGDIF